MPESQAEKSDELQEVELASARIKLRLEERKLKWWYIAIQVLSSPAIIAAVLAAAIPIGFSIYSQKQIDAQKQVDEARLNRESDKGVLLGILNPADPSVIASKLNLFLETGVINNNQQFRQIRDRLQGHDPTQFLQNILRASHDLPLSFEFRTNDALSMLRPLDLQGLNFFIRQGYSRELLFWLFVDSIQMSLGQNIVGMRYDPPSDFGCDPNDPRHLCLRDYLVIMIVAGLTVEELTYRPIGTGIARTESGSAAGRVSETKLFARLCFDPILGRRAQVEMGELWQIIKKVFDVSAAEPKCGSRWDPLTDAQKLQPDTLNINLGPFQYKIVPRSVSGVIQFLGDLLRVQRERIGPSPTTYVPPGRDDVLSFPILTTVHDDQNLLTVIQDGKISAKDCFVNLSEDGHTYCVPDDAATTKRIFGILATLLLLNQESSK